MADSGKIAGFDLEYLSQVGKNHYSSWLELHCTSSHPALSWVRDREVVTSYSHGSQTFAKSTSGVERKWQKKVKRKNWKHGQELKQSKILWYGFHEIATINPYFGQLTDLVWIVGTLFDKKKSHDRRGFESWKSEILCSLSHLGPFCLQVNSLNSIFYHTQLLWKRRIGIEWRRILCSSSRLGPICFILFSSQLFDKDDVFCIELNRIGRSYQ